MIAQNAGLVAGTQKVKWEGLQFSMGLGYEVSDQLTLHSRGHLRTMQNENKKEAQSLKLCKGHGWNTLDL